MVTNLLTKTARQKPLVAVNLFEFNANGIIGHVPCSPLRQVLILPQSILREYDLKAGDLRENIIVDYDSLHDLPSGTVIQIGESRIQLTFHCEPCKVISDKVNLCTITHKRGFLGRFLNQGRIRINDSFTVLGQQYESIPYNITDRLKWYLDKQALPVKSTYLLNEIGLSLSYARALPSMLSKLPPEYRNRVIFGKQENFKVLDTLFPI